MKNDALNPETTPDGLNKKPIVRRMTKVPILIACSLVGLVLIVLVYTVAKRADKQESQLAEANSDSVLVVDVNSVQGAGNFAKEMSELFPDVNENAIRDQSALNDSVPIIDENAVSVPPTEAELLKNELDELRYEMSQLKAHQLGDQLARQQEYNREPTAEELKAKAELKKIYTSIRDDKFSAFKQAVTAETSIEGSSGSGVGGASTGGDLNSTANSIRAQGNQRLGANLATISGAETRQAQSLNGGSSSDDFTLDNVREASGRYELKTGGVLPAILRTGINSDLSGTVLANVSQNVYDTGTGRHLLIPQGTQLYGRYANEISPGDTRTLVRWNRLTFPDGSTLNLGSMIGSDREGYAGFQDKVNNHYFKIFGSAFLLSAFSTAVAVSTPEGDSDSDNRTNQEELSLAVSQQFNETASQIIRRNLDIAPTLIQRNGYKFNIIINKDIDFNSHYKPIKKG